MIKKILFGLSILLTAYSYGQDDLADDYKKLYKEKAYDKIIKHKPKRKAVLSSKALYYKGMSYYMKMKDDKAMKYLDRAIEKGPVDHDMFYYKGMLLYYAGKLDESLPNFRKAIELLPNEPDFHQSLGEALYKLNKLDSAKVHLQNAVEHPRANNRSFILMGAVCQEQNDLEGAYVAYSTVFVKLELSDERYQDCSFNLGLIQQLTGRDNEAKQTFENHLKNFPNDFHAMAKLIQAYYANSEFEEALPYKTKLYKAFETGTLPNEMNTMFCFDQFDWNGRNVMVFESFDEPDDFMYEKHHFYIMDEDGEIDYKIDSESSLAIRMQGSETKYVLCLVKDSAHFTYWQYSFNDDFKYPEMRSAVLDILNNKVKPSAAFIPGGSKD